MNVISRHLSSRGIAGLASVCIAMTVISWIGRRSCASLVAEQTKNQIERSAIQFQIENTTRSISSENAQAAQNTTLAKSVGAWPLSRAIAEVSAKLPTNCCVEKMRLGFGQKASVEIRCADVTALNLDRAFEPGTFRTNFRSLGDRSGIGVGWTADQSVTGVLSIDFPPPPTVGFTMTTAN